MTDLDLYDAVLIEINKLEAPSMLLEDYNHFINKAVQQYINKKYNGYEINQQSTDDLNFLRVSKEYDILSKSSNIAPGEDKYFYINLPTNYLHILNAIVIFDKNFESTSVCKDKVKSKLNVLCRRITSDQFPSILINAYFRPEYTRPYFFLHDNTVEQEVEFRVGSTKKYTPSKVHIDYLKKPEKIILTDRKIMGNDEPTELEFSDYIAYEVINEVTKLLLENTSDPRLQTNNAVNQTIGNIQSQ